MLRLLVQEVKGFLWPLAGALGLQGLVRGVAQIWMLMPRGQSLLQSEEKGVHWLSLCLAMAEMPLTATECDGEARPSMYRGSLPLFSCCWGGGGQEAVQEVPYLGGGL